MGFGYKEAGGVGYTADWGGSGYKDAQSSGPSHGYCAGTGYKDFQSNKAAKMGFGGTEKFEGQSAPRRIVEDPTELRRNEEMRAQARRSAEEEQRSQKAFEQGQREQRAWEQRQWEQKQWEQQKQYEHRILEERQRH